MKALINGHHLHVLTIGDHDAMPVIFLHGFPMSHAMWNNQLPRVASRFRTIAYDLLGHGLSDVGDGQFSIEAHVDDLMALLDFLRIDRTVIAGLSMGGYIALRALERHPDRFRAAILSNTRSEADTNEGKIGRATTAGRVKHMGSAAFADEFVKKLFAEESERHVPEAVALIRDIIAHTPPLSIAGTLLALAGRTDTTESLSRIAVPTLILVGEHDVLTPPSCSRTMHERIPGSALHVIPQAGHLAPLENPGVYNTILMEFLEKI